MDHLILGASALALKTCLADTLMELAAYHGNKPGKWLDDLEYRFIQYAKGWHSEGIPLKNEILIVDKIVAFIQLATNDVRERLSRLQNDN
jgi:hypothetical protein